MTVIEQSSNVEQALAQIGLFEHLSPEELKKLAIHCRWCSFRPNERIIDPESTTTDVYIVVRGTARIVNHSLSGREISFEDIGSGSYFGELSAIDSQPRSAGAIALDSALLLRLSSRAFVGCVTSDRIAALAVMNRLARMVRQADERIMDLSTLAADLRRNRQPRQHDAGNGREGDECPARQQRHTPHARDPGDFKCQAAGGDGRPGRRAIAFAAPDRLDALRGSSPAAGEAPGHGPGPHPPGPGSSDNATALRPLGRSCSRMMTGSDRRRSDHI